VLQHRNPAKEIIIMANTIPNLSQRQIMLSFSYLAYCGEEITTPNPQTQILDLINAAMPKVPPISSPNPTWQVVWGPAVYTTPGALYQDNMMFAAQNQSDPSQIVVAIRGTNFVADLDWLMEDFDVRQTMPWPPGSGVLTPPQPMMSESTSVDLQILFAMNGATYSGRTPGPSVSLMQFLLTQTSSPIQLCVTGHSLGGCLAGTFALYLKDNPSLWDASGQSNVSCITFAAPTAGNAAFAAYSDSRFSGAPNPPNWDPTLGTTCDAVRCNFDVAPMAWIASNLSASTTSSPLFQIYAPPAVNPPNIDFTKMPFAWDFAWTETLKYVLPDIAATLSSQNYAQVVAGAAPIEGTFNTAYVGDTNNGNLLTYMEAFLAQAAYQHSFSYPIVLQVPALNDSTIIVRGATAETTTGVRMIPRLARPLMERKKLAAAQ
jgi:Lipase (class 3)